jgi:leader peptidase (prepilin peptidase) / N-methyltransferase
VSSLPPLLAALMYVLVALAGLLAGVCVNLLADRVAGDEEPPWRGGDCAACRKPLPERRLVPIAGVFLLGRRCPACGAPLPLRRALVDGALLLAFPLLLAHAYAPGSETHLAPSLIFAVDALAATVMALIFVLDLEHRLIFDVVVYPTAAALIGVALLLDHKALAGMAIGAIISGGLFLLFYALGFALYHEEALGFGDVKLAVLVGMIVGWPGIVAALVLCALIGAAVTVLLLGLGRVSKRTYIPFGTFLSLGGALALLLAVPFW